MGQPSLPPKKGRFSRSSHAGGLLLLRRCSSEVFLAGTLCPPPPHQNQWAKSAMFVNGERPVGATNCQESSNA